MCGMASRVVRTADMKFSASEASHSSSVTDRMPSKRGATAPALLTRMSTPPRSAAAATSAFGPSRGGQVGGDEGGRAGRLQRLQFRAVVPGAGDRRRRRLPTNAWLMARPIPLLAPVTTATLWFRFMSMPMTMHPR